MKQTMKQQLKNLLPRKEAYKGLLPTPTGKDGVTHINVGRQPTTDLGKKLNFISHTPFVINLWLDTLVSGQFNSIDALWKFIKSPSRDDRLRKSSVNQIIINKAEKQLKKNVYIPNFKRAIVYATHQKIIQNPEIIELIKITNEEFKSRNQEFLLDMYTTKVVDGVMWRERPPEAMWFIRGINLVVQNMLNGNFSDDYKYDWLVDDFQILANNESRLTDYLNLHNTVDVKACYPKTIVIRRAEQEGKSEIIPDLELPKSYKKVKLNNPKQSKVNKTTTEPIAVDVKQKDNVTNLELPAYIKWDLNRNFEGAIVTPNTSTPICHTLNIIYGFSQEELDKAKSYFDERVTDSWLPLLKSDNDINIDTEIFYNFTTYKAITIGQFAMYVNLAYSVIGDELYNKDFSGLGILFNNSLFDSTFLEAEINNLMFDHSKLIEARTNCILRKYIGTSLDNYKEDHNKSILTEIKRTMASLGNAKKHFSKMKSIRKDSKFFNDDNAEKYILQMYSGIHKAMDNIMEEKLNKGQITSLLEDTLLDGTGAPNEVLLEAALNRLNQPDLLSESYRLVRL